MVKGNFPYEASIIVMNKNRIELLEKCLKSIEEFTRDVYYELIIVDALSIDGSRDYLLKNWSERASLIFESDNTSYAASNNRAMKWSYGKYIYLLNNDCQARPHWLRNAIDFAEQNPEVGHVASLVLWPNGTVMSHGANLDRHGNTVVPCMRKSQNALELREIGNYAYAGFGLYKREVLEKIGYLPEFNVPIYWDDTSYSLDVWSLGYDVRYCPSSQIVHVLYHSDREHHREHKALERGRKEFMALWSEFLEKNNGFAPSFPFPFKGERPWRNGER